MPETIVLNSRIPEEMAGKRLDQVLAELFPEYSRSRLQQWIKAGQVLLDGKTAQKPKDKVEGGEQIAIQAEQVDAGEWQAESIPLEVVYEDEDLIVINKQAGIVVHPGAGNPDGTMLNALLHHAPELKVIPRAGIVHRLDKDTSGLMVVAKTLTAQKSLVEQLQERTVKREYEAVVKGVMTAGGMVDEPIGRHHKTRTRMAVVDEDEGKPAITHYRVIERFRAHTHIRVQLETGRTHQIRVHMSHVNYPLIGDPVYGGRLQFPKGCSEALKEKLGAFKRQALHAAQLTLIHPKTGEEMSWQAPLPEDMVSLLKVLRQDLKNGA